MLFQSACPLRGTTVNRDEPQRNHGISIRVPLAGARQGPSPVHPDAGSISIRVPLAGHDPQRTGTPSWGRDFNPRAPCGARPISAPPPPRRSYFNPRAPCGARHDGGGKVGLAATISIRVPLAGHDCRANVCHPQDHHFNPRAPCGARPGRTAGADGGDEHISIRVPLAGHDGKKAQRLLCIFVKTG